MKVLTGVTGSVGGEAARLLAEAGLPTRWLVRDPAKAPDLPGAQVVVADYADAEALARGLAPGDDVFMVSVNAAHDDRMLAHRTFVEAAAKAGVGHLVYLSFMCAGPDAKFLHAHGHGETEAMIAATGIPYTFLRTALYDRVTLMVFKNGLAHGPGGAGKVSWVSAADCGAVVAAVMRDPAPHAGKTYDVTGPEALGLAETASVINQGAGTHYRYVDDDYDPAERMKTLAPGLPKHMPLYQHSEYVGIAAGEFGIVTDVVERLTGRPALPLGDFVERNKAAYRAAQG